MLWRKERKRERRRSITQLPLWMKTQRCMLGTCTQKSLFFWCLIVHLSIHQCDWLRRFSWTSVKVSGAGALIRWLWYFSWIAERTMNVKSFNCSSLGRTDNSAGRGLDIWSSCHDIWHHSFMKKLTFKKMHHLSHYRDSTSDQRSLSIIDN